MKKCTFCKRDTVWLCPSVCSFCLEHSATSRIIVSLNKVKSHFTDEAGFYVRPGIVFMRTDNGLQISQEERRPTGQSQYPPPPPNRLSCTGDVHGAQNSRTDGGSNREGIRDALFQ